VSEEETALAEKLKGFFEGAGARVSLMSPAEHDRMMSLILDFLISLLSSLRIHCWNLATCARWKPREFHLQSADDPHRKRPLEDPELYGRHPLGLPDVSEYESSSKKRRGVDETGQ
jgi:prephenate dehydrogenase